MKNSLCFLFLILSFSTCNAPLQKQQSLMIATAANMQFAMQELTEAFSKKTAIPCHLVLSSSGKLTAQIKEGAPYAIFVSADMKYPQTLFNAGLTSTSPKIYAYGKLVLWSFIDNFQPSIAVLSSDTIQHIALANPQTAPYGLAAKKVLKHYKLWDAVEEKLVYGESIAQANQFINSQAAEIGFTAKSVVLASKMKDKGHWIDIDENTYEPIAQGVVQLKHQEVDAKAAQAFYDFLFSAEAINILHDFGYATQ